MSSDFIYASHEAAELREENAKLKAKLDKFHEGVMRILNENQTEYPVDRFDDGAASMAKSILVDVKRLWEALDKKGRK